MRRMRVPAVLALAGLLAACAATPVRELGSVPPRHQPGPELQAAAYPVDVHDPLEGLNRSIYMFNARFDEQIFLPVVNAYRYVLPDFVERRISSFFANLTEFRNGTNGLLQLRPDVTGRAVIRFALNTTIGLIGLFDVATPMGVDRHAEDFGQTLGRWGVGPGPFLVLPILGPSSLRDFAGFAADAAIGNGVPPQATVNDWVYSDPSVYLLYAVDQRRNVSFRYYGTGSPFEYDLVRFLYMKKRELEIAQ